MNSTLSWKPVVNKKMGCSHYVSLRGCRRRARQRQRLRQMSDRAFDNFFAWLTGARPEPDGDRKNHE
jgi:hypothetical protein